MRTLREHREGLEQKLITLHAQRDQLLANANATAGAIEFAKQEIADLRAEEALASTEGPNV